MVFGDKGRVWMRVGGGEECDGIQGEQEDVSVCVYICVRPGEEDNRTRHPLALSSL